MFSRKNKLLKFFILAVSFVLIASCSNKDDKKESENVLNIETKANDLLKQMTLDEKIQLVHGDTIDMILKNKGAGLVKGIERLGIPDIKIADSAAGVRFDTEKATGFPSNISLAASWDKELSEEYGKTVAKELKALGFNQGLGGGINITREPRNGRTFEYMGEDPILAGTLVSSRTKGTQSENVIASVKHFAANNQETNRFTSNSIVDEKTLREIYLRGFELAIKDSEPATIMCAYNKVNGDKSCENTKLLTDILKKEWGFDGYVQTDWFMALTDTVKAANAGADEEEPGSQNDYVVPFDLGDIKLTSYFNQKLKAAIKSGKVKQSRLDDMVLRKLRVLYKLDMIGKPAPTESEINSEEGKELALETAENGITLLKNIKKDNNAILPLNADNAKTVAIIGGNADKAVMGGGGSAVSPTRNKKPVDCVADDNNKDVSMGGLPTCAPWQESSIVNSLKENLPNSKIIYESGENLESAKNTARLADITILVGTRFETEMKDLPNLLLPSNNEDNANQKYDQNILISEVAEVANKSVVVLESGTAVTMPWLSKVDSVLTAWYPGEMGGKAIANVITGEVNPSGKLPITFPKSEVDLPQKSISATELDVNYAEKTYVGYRWYQSQNIEPLFPFGFGLSYTDFEYSNIKVEKDENNKLKVSFDLKNSGKNKGTEVPQIYIKLPDDKASRLISWDKVELDSGESKNISLEIPAERLSVWNGQWMVPAGKATVFVSKSAQDDNALSQDIELVEKKLSSGV